MHIKEITREQAFHAINTGEFDNDVIASEKKVAVILTQDWCPKWHSMRAWVHTLEGDFSLFELIYNQVEYFDEFRKFKESKWKNGIIPYIRYYRDGKFVHETNNVSREEFLKNLGQDN
jgi:hypothetical protein